MAGMGVAEGPKADLVYLLVSHPSKWSRNVRTKSSASFYWRAFIGHRKNANRCVEITHRWDVNVPVGRDERFIWEIDRRGFRYFEKISRRKRWNAALCDMWRLMAVYVQNPIRPSNINLWYKIYDIKNSIFYKKILINACLGVFLKNIVLVKNLYVSIIIFWMLHVSHIR